MKELLSFIAAKEQLDKIGGKWSDLNKIFKTNNFDGVADNFKYGKINS